MGPHSSTQLGRGGVRPVDQTSITTAGVIDTFLVLLIGVGPKIALVPYLQITAALDEPTKRRVRHKMLVTAATVAVALVVFGELLRVLLHFSVGSLSIAGGLILLVLAVAMVLGQPGGDRLTEGKDPMQLAQVPLAVPYLLNPVGIVGLVTVSAEAKSVTVLAVRGRNTVLGASTRRGRFSLGGRRQLQTGRKPHVGHRKGLRLSYSGHSSAIGA